MNYSIGAKEGERVILNGDIAGMPLIEEVYRALLHAGAFPYVSIGAESIAEILLKEGSAAQLQYIHEPTRCLFEQYDARIFVFAQTNTHYLSQIDNKRLQLRGKGMHSLLKTSMERTASGEFRWCGAPYPTQAAAQDAHMSLRDYEDFVYKACHVDIEDPIAEWKARDRWQQRLVDWLQGKDQVTIRGENIDLSLSVKDRKFINDDGHFNMPGGEVFTGPVERSVNGWVRFSYPAVYNGNEVEDVQLTFEQGKVVDATAARNNDYLQAVLDTDEGARYLGEWAIGTNYGIDRFTRNILFDEKIGGTLHVALGAGYPETGNTNNSAVHWDMICDLRDGAEIHVDGELFYKGGEFMIE
ncbi:MAG: aminopeptidase [Anaerolineales bacterium]|nr:aminopeptidase [Anaerolineales bacterium]